MARTVLHTYMSTVSEFVVNYANLQNGPCKHSSKTAEENHLPDGPAHAEECSSDGNTTQGEDQDRLPPKAIGGLCPSVEVEHRSGGYSAFPQKIMTHIWVTENKLSIKPA